MTVPMPDLIDSIPPPTDASTLRTLLSMMSYGGLVAAVVGMVVCTVGLARHRTISGRSSESIVAQTDTKRMLLHGLAISLGVGAPAVAGVILL